MKHSIYIAILLTFVFTSCGKNFNSVDLHKELKNGKTLDSLVSLKSNEKLVATIDTDFGTIEIELFPNEVPITVKNFIGLALEGYYDGLSFHRVIKGFMIQTGDSTGSGSGGRSIYGHPFEDEFTRSLRHDSPGIVSMANKGPNTNTSQFFITVAPVPDLDGRHAIFGKVIDGLETVNKISMQPTDANDAPITKIIMKNVKIEKRIFQ